MDEQYAHRQDTAVAAFRPTDQFEDGVAVEASEAPNNTKRIARNSVWYGAEMGSMFVTAMIASVAMARIIGPHKLGYFNYVMWLSNMSGLAGSMGIPAATSKYMAEYIGAGQHGVARSIFSFTSRLQLGISTFITTAALMIVFVWGDPAHRAVSAFQVASMLPSMLTFVPAQANAARENFRANAVASVAGNAVYLIAVILSLTLGWGLLGIAIGILVYRTVECIVRVIPVLTWLRAYKPEKVPDEIKARVFRFSRQNFVLMLLNIVVWDRSDVVILKFMSKDISQITFFTVAFNLVEKALLVPQTFGAAVGATINAQYGRDRSRLNTLVAASAKYMLLFSVPMLLGLAAVSSPAIRIIYGLQYLPVIPVLAIAASLAVFKPMLTPAQQLLQANEQQRFLIFWGITCGVVNVLIDIWLIPKHGAFGAAIGNGVAQLLGVIGPWFEVESKFKLRLDHVSLIKIIAAGLVMTAAIVAVQMLHKPLVELILGCVIGMLTFALSLRVLKMLKEEDVRRMIHFKASLPAPAHRPYFGLVTMISGLPVIGVEA